MSDADTVPVWARRRFQRLVGRGLTAALARRIVMPSRMPAGPLPAEEVPPAARSLIRYPVLASSSDAV
jgi:hypothetical protein